jgi:spermidine synthase
MNPWVERLITVDKECIVVGLGSGDHIADLAKQKNMQKIYVVDCRPELVPAFRSRFPGLDGTVEIIIVRTARGTSES